MWDFDQLLRSRDSFPIACSVLTSHDIDVETSALHVLNPEMIISKVYLGSEDYGKCLTRIFEGGLKRQARRASIPSFDLKRYQPAIPERGH